MPSRNDSVDGRSIDDAYSIVSSTLPETPLFTSNELDSIAGFRLVFKGEHLQKTGSFKVRGALNAIHRLVNQGRNHKGVVTHSSGNHGMALSWASRLMGVQCTVVVPANAPECKLAAIRRYGGNVVVCEPTIAARRKRCAEIVATNGCVEVSSHNDDDIIAGNATVCVELLKQRPDIDALLVPVGGGGLAAGVSAWAKFAKPNIKVYCVQPSAKGLERDIAAGEPIGEHRTVETIADGLRVGRVGDRCFPLIFNNTESDIISVDDDAIREHMKLSWRYLKQVIETSSACSVAAAMSSRFKSIQMANRFATVGVILCGGNVDLDDLPWIERLPSI